MKHTIFVGHYGSGKTSVAVNYAIELKKKSDKPVYIIDLDLVNPYFGSFDNADILNENGVTLLNPSFAGTNLDAPSLPSSIQRVFSSDCEVVWDLGGDDAGSFAIGRYHDKIKEQGYEMLYVVNRCRPLTPDSDSMLDIIREISVASRLSATGIVNNSNLGIETTAETVLSSLSTVNELSEKSGLPIAFISVCDSVYDSVKNSFDERLKKIHLYTRKYF